MRRRADREAAFLNIPYDSRYEPLFLAFLSGLSAFGLLPRATIEIPSATRRLDRIIELIRSCSYSFHDISRVQLDRSPPATPRFNMPFELGLAVDWARDANRDHEWFVFEARPHRLAKSLSDLNGTDPFIHGGTAFGVLRVLTSALSRRANQPTLSDLAAIYGRLRKVAARKRSELKGGSLFEARPFADLLVVARELARGQIPSLRD
jgi:hypothetical protein